MEILTAREDFGPVKKGDQLFALPEHRMLLSTFICSPIFMFPKLFIIEFIGVILNQDEKRTAESKTSSSSASENDYIIWVDVRMLKGVERIRR